MRPWLSNAVAPQANSKHGCNCFIIPGFEQEHEKSFAAHPLACTTFSTHCACRALVLTFFRICGASRGPTEQLLLSNWVAETRPTNIATMVDVFIFAAWKDWIGRKPSWRLQGKIWTTNCWVGNLTDGNLFKKIIWTTILCFALIICCWRLCFPFNEPLKCVYQAPRGIDGTEWARYWLSQI